MIRRATPGDIPSLLDLLDQVNAVHAEARPDIFLRGVKYSEKELETMVADDENPIFVAVSEITPDMSQVHGYIFCQERVEEGDGAVTRDRKTFFIDDLCIDEAARGNGVGSALVDYVASYSRSHGFDNITLHVWHSNPGALAFYENLGMKPLVTTMELPLDEPNPVTLPDQA